MWVQVAGALGLSVGFGCSSDEASSNNNTTGGQTGGPPTATGGVRTGTGGASAATGGASASNAVLGTFSVTLNPPVGDSADAFTSISGKVYSGEYPTDVIETPSATAGGCTTYEFSRQPCLEVACTTSQVCAAPEDCRERPRLVGVGAVSVSGIGAGPLALSVVNNNYQYAGDIPYPGFEDGATISLTANGDHYPAFTVSTTGVAPVSLSKDEYLLTSGDPLLVEWAPGTNDDAEVILLLNISKHGGSPGYLRCDTVDSGSFTIPAGPIQALIDLGVAGFPQLTVTRRTRGEAAVNGGKIVLDVAADAIPTLAVEGYCSCNDAGDCGSCSDPTKTVCDPLRRLCNAP
jgi:hypothetical protein